MRTVGGVEDRDTSFPSRVIFGGNRLVSRRAVQDRATQGKILDLPTRVLSATSGYSVEKLSGTDGDGSAGCSEAASRASSSAGVGAIGVVGGVPFMGTNCELYRAPKLQFGQPLGLMTALQ